MGVSFALKGPEPQGTHLSYSGIWIRVAENKQYHEKNIPSWKEKIQQ